MDKSPLVLPLDFISTVDQKTSAREAQALWLAIVFPRLALELFQVRSSESAVIVESRRGRYVVYMASAAAESEGIRAGMALSAAYALSEALRVLPYKPKRLKKKLRQLAHRAFQFSSKVNLYPPDALLLEVRGSLKLYGGLEALQKRLRDDLQSHGYSIYMAVTPTPAASLLLARSARQIEVRKLAALRSALGEVPVRYLPLSEANRKQLHNVGIQVFRDLCRLPKEALARRFGRELALYLEQVLGQAVDLAEDFSPTPVFQSRYDLHYELSDSHKLLKVFQKLLEQLEEYLWLRDLLLHQCVFDLHHHKGKTTRMPVRMRSPVRDQKHMMLLAETLLEQLQLKLPVVAVSLRARDFVANERRNYELFDHGENSHLYSQQNMEMLLQQLQLRLGSKAVQAMYVVHDHRPEYAVRFCTELHPDSNMAPKQQRPLWLLEQSQLLSMVDGCLWFHGKLELVSGPERIESGWWSGSDIRRDYYIVKDRYHRLLWVYKELVQQRWYLHGLFA